MQHADYWLLLLPFVIAHMNAHSTLTAHVTLTRGSPCKCKRVHINNRAISASITCTSTFNVFKRNLIYPWISVDLCLAVIRSLYFSLEQCVMWEDAHSYSFCLQWHYLLVFMLMLFIYFLSAINPSQQGCFDSACLFSNP